MPTINQSQLQAIFDKAEGQKLDRGQIVQELVNRGNIIEGLNEPPKPTQGFFSTMQQKAASSMSSYGDPLGKVAGGLVRAAEYVASPLAAASGLIQKGLGVNGQDAQELPQQAAMARTSLPLTVGLATAPLSLPVSAAATGLAGFTGRGMNEASDAITGKDQQSFGGRVMDAGLEGGITAAFDAGTGLAFKGLSMIAPKFAGGLKESAKNTIQKALGATTKPLKKQAGKVAAEMLERPMADTFALTRTGLEGKASAAKELVGEGFDELGKLEGKTPVSSIVDLLEQEKSAFAAGGKVVDQGAVDQISTIQDVFRQYGDDIDDETMRKVGQIFGKKVAKSKGFQKSLSEGTELDLKKVAYGKIRDILAEKNPELAKLNKEYNFWSSLEEITKATNERTAGQTPLLPGMSAVAGAASGNGGINMLLRASGFHALTNVVRSTGWRLVSARAKSELADALVKNDLGTLFKILSEATAQTSARTATQDE